MTVLTKRPPYQQESYVQRSGHRPQPFQTLHPQSCRGSLATNSISTPNQPSAWSLRPGHWPSTTRPSKRRFGTQASRTTQIVHPSLIPTAAGQERYRAITSAYVWFSENETPWTYPSSLKVDIYCAVTTVGPSERYSYTTSPNIRRMSTWLDG